jgi:hypothetical protein
VRQIVKAAQDEPLSPAALLQAGVVDGLLDERVNARSGLAAEKP